jgi:hypothetical protein
MSRFSVKHRPLDPTIETIETFDIIYPSNLFWCSGLGIQIRWIIKLTQFYICIYIELS